MNYFEEIRSRIEQEPDFYPNSSEPEVGQGLFILCRMFGALRVLEIGVWKGYTSTYLAEAVGWSHVWLVDIEDHLSQAIPEDGKRRLVVGHSHDIIPKLPQCFFDLVFLDADHQYESTKRELELLLPKVSDRGVICCHDSLLCPGVRKAIDEFGWDKVHLPTVIKPEKGKMCGLSLLVNPKIK